jgi:hypothetical protein
VSAEFMRDNSISYNRVSAPPAALADGSSLAILGIARNLHMSIGHFKFTETFLVVDVSNLEVVLGMTFLERYNPRFDWQERRMHVNHKNTELTLPANTANPLPTLNSERF